MFILSAIEIRHKGRHCQWENSFAHIKFIKKKTRKKQWNCWWEKMSKAIEENRLQSYNKNTCMRIQFILKIYKYGQKHWKE